MKKELTKNISIAMFTWAFCFFLAFATGANNLILISLILIFSIQNFFSIFSVIFKTDLFFDFVGSGTFFLVVFWSMISSPNIDSNKIIISLLILIWSLRLGYFLTSRRVSRGKDKRLMKIFNNHGGTFMAWNVQGFWIFCCLLSSLNSIYSENIFKFGLLQWSGLLIWIIGFLIEVISDQQKKVFNKKNTDKSRFISSGLWSISRHPNYLGEIILWLGIFIISFAYLGNWSYLSVISPISIIIILRFVSGVPQLEKNAIKKWGDNKEYKKYIDETPILFPKIFN